MKYINVTFAALLVTFELLPVDKNFLTRLSVYPALFIIALILASVFRLLRERDFFANAYEDLHVISQHPKTGEHFEFTGDLEDANKYIFNVPYHKVRRTQNELYKKLQAAENPNINPGLAEEEKIYVHTHVFQQGERINETWPEFCEYVEEQIKQARAERHNLLYAKNRNWYLKFHELQD